MKYGFTIFILMVGSLQAAAAQKIKSETEMFENLVAVMSKAKTVGSFLDSVTNSIDPKKMKVISEKIGSATATSLSIKRLGKTKVNVMIDHKSISLEYRASGPRRISRFLVNDKSIDTTPYEGTDRLFQRIEAALAQTKKTSSLFDWIVPEAYADLLSTAVGTIASSYYHVKENIPFVGPCFWIKDARGKCQNIGKEMDGVYETFIPTEVNAAKYADWMADQKVNSCPEEFEETKECMQSALREYPNLTQKAKDFLYPPKTPDGATGSTVR